MAVIGLKADVKKLFFDRAAVMKSVRADQRRYFAKAGAFARKTASFSIRKAAKPKFKPHPKGPDADLKALAAVASKPGEPPKSRTGLLRKNIFFAFEPPNNVIVGPVKLSAKQGAVPKVLEKGGKSRRVIRRNGTPIGTELITIEPRPYMEPALQATVPKLPELYRSSIRSL